VGDLIIMKEDRLSDHVLWTIPLANVDVFSDGQGVDVQIRSFAESASGAEVLTFVFFTIMWWSIKMLITG
jgi:hypothetical protein